MVYFTINPFSEIPMFCDFCGAVLMNLGILGNIAHLRCRGCGMNYSTNADGLVTAENVVTHLAAEDARDVEDAEPDFNDSLPGDFDEPFPERGDFEEPMDGDHESGLASAGLGTDEDYEHNLFDDADNF
jgi:hypothetical protein